VNALIGTGVKVHRAKEGVRGRREDVPGGSYVVKGAQAFRAHVLDMFEPQDHPDDFAYPGAPPTPPYDAAGYTLAFQMGVRFDRLLDGVSGPFEELKGRGEPPRGRRGSSRFRRTGYYLDAPRRTTRSGAVNSCSPRATTCAA
jgi:hypothetical protein